MADVKISQLPFTSSICNTALVAIVQNGMTCSAYVCDIAPTPPPSSIIVAGTGCNSSIRCDVGNSASGAYSSTIGGGINCNLGVLSAISGGGTNIIGCYNLVGAACLTTSSYVYCANPSTNSIYMYGDYTADLVVGNCLAYFNCYDNKFYSGVVTCSTYSGNYTQIQGICAGTTSGYICTPLRNLSLVCNSVTNYSFIGGGIGNTISARYSFLGGGTFNTACGCSSVVVGGKCSTASCDFATIVGGRINTASGYASFIGSGRFNTSSCNNSAIVSGSQNTASGYSSFVGGGGSNTASGYCSFVGGGSTNTASNSYSFVGGGKSNTSSEAWSTIAGGLSNVVSCTFSFIGGGRDNNASSDCSAILGGCCNNTCGFATAMIVGNNINADRACATFVNNLSIKNIPTSPAGLPAGSVYSNSGVLTIV